MSKDSEIIIDFEPISRRLYYKRKESIYQLLVGSGIRIRSLCGGLGTCGKCKLIIQQGNQHFNPITNSEKNLLTREEISENFRLACQCHITEDQIDLIKSKPEPQIRVFLPQEILIEDFKILTAGLNKGINLNPNVKKIFIEVDKPNLKKPTPDLESIISALLSKSEIYKNQIKPSFEYETLKKFLINNFTDCIML